MRVRCVAAVAVVVVVVATRKPLRSTIAELLTTRCYGNAMLSWNGKDRCRSVGRSVGGSLVRSAATDANSGDGAQKEKTTTHLPDRRYESQQQQQHTLYSQ